MTHLLWVGSSSRSLQVCDSDLCSSDVCIGVQYSNTTDRHRPDKTDYMLKKEAEKGGLVLSIIIVATAAAAP